MWALPEYQRGKPFLLSPSPNLSWSASLNATNTPTIFVRQGHGSLYKDAGYLLSLIDGYVLARHLLSFDKVRSPRFHIMLCQTIDHGVVGIFMPVSVLIACKTPTCGIHISNFLFFEWWSLPVTGSSFRCVGPLCVPLSNLHPLCFGMDSLMVRGKLQWNQPALVYTLSWERERDSLWNTSRLRCMTHMHIIHVWNTHSDHLSRRAFNYTSDLLSLVFMQFC